MNKFNDYTWSDVKKFNPKYKEYLDSKSKCYSIVFQWDNSDCSSTSDIARARNFSIGSLADLPFFGNYLNQYCSYWLIAHLEDVDEVGKPTKPHVHLVVMFDNAVRIQQVFDLVCSYYGFSSTVLDDDWLPAPTPWLSCKVTKNLVGSLRYLVHLDNPDKFQYDPKYIVTNDRGRFEGSLVLNGSSLTTETIINLCNICDFRASKIASLIGLSSYTKFRNVINDFRKEIKNS